MSKEPADTCLEVAVQINSETAFKERRKRLHKRRVLSNQKR